MDNNTIQAESFTRAAAKSKRRASFLLSLSRGESSVAGEEDLSSSTNAQEHQKKTEKKSIKISLKTVIIILVIIAFGALYIFKGLFIAATVNGTPISRLTVIQKLEKS